MPFRAADSEQRPRVSLLQVAPNLWQLQTPFRYDDITDQSTITIRAHDITKPADEAAGNATDLASVPWVLWNLISSFGRQTLPALLHDQRCVKAQQIQKAGDTTAALTERRAADSQLYRSLVDEGVTKFRAGVMWTAVSLAAYGTHSKPRFYALIARLVLATALTFTGLAAVFWHASPGLGSHDLSGAAGWFLIAAAAVVIVAGRERRLVLLSTLLLPIFGPVMIIQLAFAILLLIPAFGVKATKGGSWPQPGPYLRK